MALPDKTTIQAMGVSWRGAPFVRVEAKALSTDDLDWSWRGAPFVAAPPATSATFAAIVMII